ncbi:MULTISPECIES: aldose 1-epimerase family protein [Rhizobium/Agrobacterium group]|uniref:aldose 1-epimerase family protein n=1 Tax=Rhizobium/Agrobacterium group TaxID=227290 RepID=UPI001ADCCF41|nr:MULTISPECIES: aldose 1-epimerase family protein [Rhizobium/Agrobacterium group]MBO9112539.1 aldose 1-epimerase family protein [Agrobacterium sp. S2/73]QXZ76045.1 aldose 1-epimerase family protein [Agrobacterium sp. S7/73]QYA16944.1 aldose 1-epimerase family protein [Rhizobium sp. AB2/73]UEQ85483.1 aldose 1-epimerase family protein [Rhizobium sp. AB2/73]
MDINLLKKSPDLRGVADIRLVAVEDGPARGQRLLIARNAKGISFEVAVDRGFDISSLAFKGLNIGWNSPTQMRYPPSDPGSEEGWGFLRNFDGFMVTCGLDHISRPRDIDISHFEHPHLKTKKMPLHGRISSERARLVGYGVDHETEEIFCEGIVRQASVFGETLELRRRITLGIFGSEIAIADAVTNRGFVPSRHAMIYHLNFGYPFLDKNLEFSGLPEVLAAKLRIDTPLPDDKYGERVDTIDSRDIPGPDPIRLSNPALDISVRLSFSRTHLNKLAIWRAYQSGVYALGVEPRTDIAEERPFLQPGESCNHTVELTFSSCESI